MTRLARLLDPDELDACEGTRARVSIEVPEDYAGQALRIELPRRAQCARCDGGGCESCGRSGAHRFADRAEERTIEVRLPPDLGEGCRLRLSRPLGANKEPAQLWLDVTVSELPSESVTLAPPEPGVRFRSSAIVSALAILFALILYAWTRH